MNFADYLFNMTHKDFIEAEQIVNISKNLPSHHELRQRVEALREIFAVCDNTDG